ncbi:MAG: integrase core domain-containing protein [Gammaproteobacteria bacterium]|jgi:transposase InsO family protein
MKENLTLFMHFICTIFKLLKPGGVKAVMAENLALKQQLITLNRGHQRSPNLTTRERFFYGLIGFLVSQQRIKKIAVVLKPRTFLRFHMALVKRKYHDLYSNKTSKKPGRKGQNRALIQLIIEIKQNNPSMGYGRIAMQVYEAFGITISRFAVGRILRKHFKDYPPGHNDGPSWLTFIGHMKDSLWSVDLFRCESILLRTHWVMVVLDQYTRRIIGFAVHAGDCDGVTYCRLFNSIISGLSLPQNVSTDNDPLFLFHRWQANLRVLEIDEIKSVPGVPTSHPFVERVIGTVRRECLDQLLFFNERDLQKKLTSFQAYYNQTRVHSSFMQTPSTMASDVVTDKKVVSLDDYRWRSHCNGLVQLPIAA